MELADRNIRADLVYILTRYFVNITCLEMSLEIVLDRADRIYKPGVSFALQSSILRPKKIPNNIILATIA